MSVPIMAIDPEAAHRQWRKQFEWHLDQVPPLMETMGVLAIPSIGVSRGGSRFDRVQITGGGYFDNVPVADIGKGVSAEAQVVWSMLVEYVKAVTAWLNVTVTAPYAPALPPLAQFDRQWKAPTVDADPLSARRLAFEAIAWLIEHADQIEPIAELDAYREELFTEIRRARGRYRGAGTRRRARPRPCGVCGECAVIVDWMTPASGSPKPVQVGKCTVCGQVYLEGQGEMNEQTTELTNRSQP